MSDTHWCVAESQGARTVLACQWVWDSIEHPEHDHRRRGHVVHCYGYQKGGEEES